MGRFGRSWELIKLCWSVLRQDKELVVFPIVSGIAVVIVTASFIVPGIFTGYWESFVGNNGSIPASMWVLIVLFYLVEYLVIIFFNAALVSAAMVRLKGGDPTLGDGLRGAWSHIGAILGWAAISATVGLVLQALRERGGFAGAIVAALGGMAWNVITFLVIPVLLVEGVNPIEGIKRSASLLKKTWGEQIIGNAGIGLIFGLICVAIAVVGVALGVVVLNAGVTAAGVAIIVVTVLAIVVVAMLSATLRGIYSAALYQYAVGGDTGVFNEELLAGAFRAKRMRTPFGG
jgi:Flp pilus assembly pilin Flp